MNIDYVRSSSYNTYEDCQHKFFITYILGIPDLAGKKALLGTIIHMVLELRARAKKNGHYLLNDKYIDPKYLLDICWNRYTKEEASRFEFINADYKFCEKSLDKVINTKFDPINLNIIKTEQQFQIPIKEPGFYNEYYDLVTKTKKTIWYELRGTIDLITEETPDILHILDWKSGRRRCWTTGKEKDYEYLSENDIQLRMYDLAISRLYPQYKHIKVTIHFINDGGPFTVSFDENQRKETLEILKNQWNNIKDNDLPTRLKEENPIDAKWKCTKVCHFGKTKAKNGLSICDNLYHHMMHNGVDKTIIDVMEIKKNKNFKQENKTSNRRNVYDSDKSDE